MIISLATKVSDSLIKDMSRRFINSILIFTLRLAPLANSDVCGQTTTDIHLKEGAIITLGDRQLSLSSGTSVKVLQRTADKATISFNLADGTPVITQVAISVLNFPVAATASPATAFASSSTDQKTPPPASTNNSPPSPLVSSQTSSPATTIPTDSTTANNILKSPDASASASASPSPPVGDPAAIINQLGAPVQSTQPDFPEPDPNLQVKQLTVDISNHPDIAARVKVVYAIPLDREGKPGPRAHHIVFYCPWYKQGNPLTDAYSKFLCGNLGLTVVSLQISWGEAAAPANPAKAADQNVDGNTHLDQNAPSPAPAVADKSSVDINSKNYTQQDIYPELAFEAQASLEAKYGLEHESLIVFGNSSGSDMAERMAIHYQEKMACVALMAGGVFEEPTAKPTIPWFVMCSRGDGNSSVNQNLVDTLHNLGARPINLTIEPQWDRGGRGGELFHHIISDDGFSLCEAYIWDIVQQMDASNVYPLTPQQWPYLSTRGFPANVYNNNVTLLQSLPDTYFSLPGKTSAFYYSKLQVHQLVTSTSYKSGIWSIEPVTKPKGIIIYDDNFDYLAIGRIIDDMYYYADNGYSVFFTKGPSIDVSDLISWIQKDAKNQDLPLFAVGIDAEAPALLKLAQNDLKGKFKGMAFVDYAFDDAEQSPLQLKQPETDCPVLYVFDSTLSGLSDGKISEIKDYVQHPPPQSFNSKFALITDSKKNQDVSAQKAVTAIKAFFDSSQGSDTK